MDLKSMLNDSAAQRPPRIHTHHTPHSSYDARVDQTPTSDLSSARPTPHGPPLQSIESRVQGGGGYFAMQSPHPNTSTTASTPSAGPHSAYAQSPGTYITSYTPRESVPTSHPHNAPFVSTSPSVVHHPPTPGSAHISYNQSNFYSNSAHNTPHKYQFQSPPPPQVNGLPPSRTRQISPTIQFQSHPATPLGPPILYQKTSPYSHRPSSQGHEQHFRRPSQSSVGSVHSIDYNHHPLPLQVDPARRDSAQKPYPSDIRDRERSISVSPKTIPKPAPYREHSTSSRTLSHGRRSLPPQPDLYATMSHPNSVDQVEPAVTPQAAPPPSVHNSTPPAAKQPSADHTIHLSPAPEPLHEPVPVQTFASLQPGANLSLAEMDRPEVIQSALKRSASHFSDSPARNKEPPTKRRRRDEIPIWAQSARGDRQLNFIDGHIRGNRPPPSVQQQRPIANPRPAAPRINGNGVGGPSTQPNEPAQPAQPAQALQPVQLVKPVHFDVSSLRWESTLADIIPFEDLTRNVCGWVLHNIKDAVPPKNSMFEIEAKIGQIMHSGNRLNLPVFSEVIVDRAGVPGLRFDSTVHLSEHQALNEYLNNLVSERLAQRGQGIPLHEILFDHPKENDEFFALSEEGKAHLDPSLLQWINNSANRARGEIKVRRTVDKGTHEAKRTIIKTRIADMEIYNPNFEFDYRISISLETDWKGRDEWLVRIPESRGRNKDRMSYRHMMFQVDLTQVSHDDDPHRKEHELEVEIATESIRAELVKLRNGEPTQYEDMMRGLLDNVRLLSRKVSAARRERIAIERGG